MNIYSLILTVSVLLFANSCGGADTVIVSQQNNNYLSNESKNNFEVLLTGTKLYGAVLDTAYNVLDDVDVFTRPRTSSTKTDDDGNFSLISSDFLPDVPHEIIFSHQDYKQQIVDGYYPNIDDENDLGLILMVPLPPEDNGGGPGIITPPSTPPDFPEDEGRD